MFRNKKLLLINVFAGLLSVSGEKKYVCPGNSVPVFQHIDFDRCNSLIYLNIIAERNRLIATWSYKNCIRNASLSKGYEARVFLDQNGTITIHNFRTFDQGTYVVFVKKDTLPSVQEVELNVMVAPSKDCKPMVTQIGDNLFATLKAEDCGYPIATPYWKGNNGDANTLEPMLKISKASETRTYTACIKSPSLKCTTDLKEMDYCTSQDIERTTHQITSTDKPSTDVISSGDKEVFPVLHIVISLLILILIIVIIYLKFHKTKFKKDAKAKYKDVHPPEENHIGGDQEMNKVGTEDHIDTIETLEMQCTKLL